MNQIFRWSPTLRVKESGDKYGVFQCKCPETTNGAKRHTGKTPMVEWDFWAVDCGKIMGRLVWIDKNFMEFNGKTKTSLSLAFKTIDGDIDILSMPFDGFSLRNVMNHLCGMKEAVFSDQITLTYGAWKKKEDGKVVIGNDGSAVWNTSLNFEGVAPLYALSKDVAVNYWDIRKEKGLEPIQTTNNKGEKSWDDSAEMAFWDGHLVRLQKKLIEIGAAIPFSYNSWICGDVVNPSGGGNHPEEIKEAVKTLYEDRVKGKYVYFNKESGTGTTASDVRQSMKATPQQETTEQTAREAAFSQPTPQRQSNGFADPIAVDFPTQAPPISYEQGANIDDIPF